MLAAGRVDPWVAEAERIDSSHTSWGNKSMVDESIGQNWGTSSASTCMTGMGIGSIASAAAQMAGSIISYVSQSDMLEKQKEMTVARYDHQDRMTQINKDMQVAAIKHKQAKMHVIKEGQEELHAAVEERKKAEDSLKIAEARKKEIELTKNTSKINKKKLDSIFKNYNYGNPVAGL